MSTDAAEGLYRLVDVAYERRSVAVSSNLHPSGFDELMPKALAAVFLGSQGKAQFRCPFACEPRRSHWVFAGLHGRERAASMSAG